MVLAYLLMEIIPAHGGNYLELPKAGEAQSALVDTRAPARDI